MPRNASQDGNQNYSLLGVGGTAGTADTKGTSLTVAVGVDPATGAAYVYNLGPAGSVSIGGTDPTAYQPVRLTDGTSFYNASGGTSGGGGTSVEVVAGTLNKLSSGTLDMLKAGTIDKVGTVVGVGTVSGMGVVSSLTNGTVTANAQLNATTLGTVTTNGDIVAHNFNNGDSSITLQVSGTWTGQLNFEVTVDGTNWLAHEMTSAVVVGGITNATTGNGIFEASIGGITSFRVRAVSAITGSAVITFKSSLGTHAVELDSSIPTGTNLIGNVGLTSGTLTTIAAGTLNTLGTVGVISALTSGTVSINTPGTITSGSVSIIAGTIGAGTLNTLGTLTNLIHGTIENSGTVTGVGVVTALTSGTIQSATIAGGTINAGTVSVSTQGTIASGSIVVTAGTIGTVSNIGILNAGTINSATVNVGSIGGRGANAAATVGFPVLVAGMDGGGTAYTFLTDTTGHFKNDMISGTLNAGTINNGTLTLVTTVSNLTNGSIKVTAGTEIVTAGTFGGFGANAAATVGFPILTAGMDSGGTAYTFLTDTSRRLHEVMELGTINSGTINAGTINSGTINAGTFTMSIGTLNSGTINAGTVTMTVGTLNSGTLNAGTINSGTINSGTINTGTINAGTFRIDPLTVVNTISSVGTTGTAAIGTLIGTSTIGAGTGVYITGFHVLAISGTPEVNLAFGTQKINNQVIAHGIFPAGGGIARDRAYPHAYGTTASPLTYEIISGAGTVSWSVDYFLHT